LGTELDLDWDYEVDLWSEKEINLKRTFTFTWYLEFWENWISDTRRMPRHPTFSFKKSNPTSTNFTTEPYEPTSTLQSKKDKLEPCD